MVGIASEQVLIHNNTWNRESYAKNHFCKLHGGGQGGRGGGGHGILHKASKRGELFDSLIF